MIPISIAFFVTVVLVGLYFLGFVLKLDNIFSAQYFYSGFWYNHGEYVGSECDRIKYLLCRIAVGNSNFYYFLLGNGATRNEAIAPFVRQALIKAFSRALPIWQ